MATSPPTHGPSLPDGLAELLDGVTAVAIWAWRIEMHFPPVPNGDTQGVELESLVNRLEALHVVDRRLSMRDGVYR